MIKNGKKTCSGCTACKHICPTSAIEMRSDDEGFQYPVINKEKCISCGKCEGICSFTDNYIIENNYTISEVYAVNGGGIDVSPKSSSAGVGNILANAFIKEGGIVYGAAFNDEFEVQHQRIASLEEIEKINGSKYVQSNLGNVFFNIQNDLLDGQKVLFFGTACQTAGLYSYISSKKLTDNLYLCDILCHGVPSPGVYKDYLNYMVHKNNCQIEKVIFRSKENGWKSSLAGQCLTFKNGKKVNMSLFSKLYFTHLILRPSCCDCKYTTLNKPSDLTIADFWKIKDFEPSMYTPHGVSMVLMNSDKGRFLFHLLSKKMNTKQMDLSCCTAKQFKEPATVNEKRDLFFSYYKTKGANAVFRKYNRIFFFEQCRNRISKILKKS